MAIKSKVKNIFLVILLVVVSTVLGAVRLFSGHGASKINQAQAQSCWTPPAPGGGGGGGEGSEATGGEGSSGSSSTGGGSCAGCDGCGCGSCSGCGCSGTT